MIQNVFAERAYELNYMKEKLNQFCIIKCRNSICVLVFKQLTKVFNYLANLIVMQCSGWCTRIAAMHRGIFSALFAWMR